MQEHTTAEFLQEFKRIMERMTEDDWRKFNNEQMEEQKTGLYAFLNENSDNTSKQSNEVREGVVYLQRFYQAYFLWQTITAANSNRIK